MSPATYPRHVVKAAIPAARKGPVGSEERRWPQMNNINTTNVGVFASAMSHVQATSLAYGVVNADQRLRRIWGDVCLATPSVQLQGSAVSTVTPAIGGTDVMGFARFDKYRWGSYAQGLTG
jgi:hypothetical protein